MTGHIIKFSPAPCHVLPLRPRNLLLHFIFSPLIHTLHEDAVNIAVAPIFIFMFIYLTSTKDVKKISEISDSTNYPNFIHFSSKPVAS